MRLISERREGDDRKDPSVLCNKRGEIDTDGWISGSEMREKDVLE